MCGGVMCVCVWRGGGEGTVNIIFIVTNVRHQQLLFYLKKCWVYPGALLRHFIEYAVFRGLVVLRLYGPGVKSCGRKKVLGHSKGLK